jgi:hypothetical protein
MAAPHRTDPAVPPIVSASRRTDVPLFFGGWFAARRRAGWCGSRSVFGREYRISLRKEDVSGWLFWSKDPTPFEGELGALLDEGQAVALQFTLNGYGATVERRIPPPERTLPAFARVSRMLPAAEAVQWRYDPLILSERFDADWHRANFRRIAAALEGRTRVCNVSVVEPYRQVVTRLGEGISYRRPEGSRHRQVLSRHPSLRFAGREVGDLVAELSGIAREHGIEARSCCDPALPLPPSACCSAEMFEPYGIGDRLRGVPAGPTRPGCGCLKSVDVGMDDTCPGGCAYCYVTRAVSGAGVDPARLAPDSARLR